MNHHNLFVLISITTTWMCRQDEIAVDGQYLEVREVKGGITAATGTVVVSRKFDSENAKASVTGVINLPEIL